jgi:Gram-negative bacterial TonB protein C-terminal
MKKLIFILFIGLIVGTASVTAQNEPISINPKELPEGFIGPTYPGGNEVFYKYVQKGIKRRHLPSKSGKVIVSFIIEKDGSLSNVKLVEGIEQKVDERIVKLISESARWTPGYIDGLPLRASYKLP